MAFGGFWDDFSQFWDRSDQLNNQMPPGVAEKQGQSSLSAANNLVGAKEKSVVQNIVLVEDTQEDDGAEADVESNNESNAPQQKKRKWLSPGRYKSYDPDSTLSEY